VRSIHYIHVRLIHEYRIYSRLHLACSTACGRHQYSFFLTQDNEIALPRMISSSRHEIAGVVTAVGSDVTTFKVGDHVGVGTYVDSCRDCDYCNARREIDYCNCDIQCH
jgi:Zn-dependent alcohol dehydrogenase